MRVGCSHGDLRGWLGVWGIQRRSTFMCPCPLHRSAMMVKLSLSPFSCSLSSATAVSVLFDAELKDHCFNES